MKRILLLCMCVCLLSVSAAFGQNQTGSQINDETAFELEFQAISQLPANLQNDTLANGVGLSPADENVVEQALASFSTQYANYISTYNSSISGVTDQPTLTGYFNTFVNNRVSLTNNTLASLQASMTPAGVAALASYITAQKTYIFLGSGYNNSDYLQMCHADNGFSSVETATVTWGTYPGHGKGLLPATITYTVTTSGVSTTNGVCPGTAYVTATVAVGGATPQTATTHGLPNQYISARANLLVYDIIDGCWEDEEGNCDDGSSGGGGDSAGAGQPFQVWFVGYWEEAYTFTILNGMGYDCFENSAHQQQCYYPVADWCTPATTPPDLEMNGSTIVYSPGYTYWDVYAVMWSYNGHQPWIEVGKGAPLSTAFGLNGSFPDASCTYNP